MKIKRKGRKVKAVRYCDTVKGHVYHSCSKYYLRIDCGMVELHESVLYIGDDIAYDAKFKEVEAEMVVDYDQ